MSLTYQNEALPSYEDRVLSTLGFTKGTSTQDTVMNVLNAVGLITAPGLTLGINFMTNAFNPKTSPFAIDYYHSGNKNQESIDKYNRWLASPEGQKHTKDFEDWYKKAYGALDLKDYWNSRKATPTETNWDQYKTEIANRSLGTSLAQQGIAQVQREAANQKYLQSMQKRTQIMQGRTADINQANQAAQANVTKLVSDVRGAVAQRGDLMSQQQQQQQQAQQQQQSLQQQQVQDAQTNLQQRTQAEIIQQQQRANAVQQAQQLAQQRIEQNKPTLKQVLTAPPRSIITKAQVKV